MSQPLQSGKHPGAHPDADQINTFVEGVASAHQREQMLAHLAECGECREIVFLLQGQAEPEPAPVVAQWTERRPRRWFFPLGLAGAALAWGVTALVYVGMHRTPQERPVEMATAKPSPAPAVAAPPPVAAPASRPEAPERKQPQAEVRPRERAEVQAQRDSAVSATGANAIDQLETAPPPSPAAPAAGSASLPSPAVAVPAPAAKAMPAPGIETAQGELKKEAANEPSVKVTGRNFAALALAPAAPALRIEHDRGPADGSSEVAGRVTDMSGAVIAGAAVALRDGAGATRQATTGGDGRFTVAGVTPGHYTLIVTAPGFERVEQTMNLQARDVARLETVLPVGTESQTVSVEAEGNSLQTQASDAAAVIEGELPSRLPETERVAMGKRVLSIDGAGTLFLSRNGGKSWKKVKPEWTGKVIQIAVTDQPKEVSGGSETRRKSNTSGNAQVFEITADDGALWASDDGTHWRKR